MKVQMFESKSPFKGQQIKLGLAAVLGSAAFLLGGCSQNLGINSGTDQAQAEEESAVVDYTCISNPDSEKKLLFILYLAVCLAIIVAAYFHLSRIARKYNTEHLELITSLYAEKILERLQKNLDQQALESEQSFNSDPYQSSQTGNMIMTVFVPVKDSSQIYSLYVSIMIENLRQLGVYELLQGKISVQLLNANS